MEPERFAYRVDRFTNILGRLVTHASGTWVFARGPDGSAFTWSGFMAQCADLCVELAEGSWPDPAGPAQR